MKRHNASMRWEMSYKIILLNKRNAHQMLVSNCKQKQIMIAVNIEPRSNGY